MCYEHHKGDVVSLRVPFRLGSGRHLGYRRPGLFP